VSEAARLSAWRYGAVFCYEEVLVGGYTRPVAEEVKMPETGYELFEALDPFFEVVMGGLRGIVDGKHYFDTFAEDATFESRYHFPGWPVTIRGRAN